MDTHNKKETTGCPLLAKLQELDGDDLVGCRLLDGQLAKNNSQETGRDKRMLRKKARKMKKDERRMKNEKKLKKNKRKRAEKTLTEKFVYMVFFVMLVILAMMAVSLLYINRDLPTLLKNSEELVIAETLGTEGTLLSTGIAIIGVAIAVWAGLNIIQVLEKDKFELLGKEVSKYSDERKRLNRTRFLESVAADSNELNKYLYEKLKAGIDEENDRIPAEVYFELSIIEEMFQLAYKEQIQPIRMLMPQYYIDAIQKCNEQMKYVKGTSNGNESIVQYLKVRIYEFCFYQGYIDRDKAVECFQNVINGFCGIFDGLKEPNKLVEENAYINGDCMLTAYMLNTIGESYSKIIQSYMQQRANVTEHIKSQANVMKQYYNALFKMIENTKDRRLIREVYYRNRGVALERVGNYIDKDESKTFKYRNEIYDSYQKALNIAMCAYEKRYENGRGVRQQAFQTWLSFYIKVMSEKNVSGLLKGEELKLDTDETRSTLEEYTDKALPYAEMAPKMFPTLPFFRRCYAFVQRDLAIWSICENRWDAARKHYEELDKTLKGIDVMEEIRSEYEDKESFPDEYLTTLNDNRNKLRKIIERQEM